MTEAPTVTVWIAQPGARSDEAVEKLTELGVARIGGLVTGLLKGSFTTARMERWRRVAEAAAKQSKQARVPEVMGMSAYADVFSPDAIVLSHEGASGGLADRIVGRRQATLLIGPEPGFSDAELPLAGERGVAVATFGPVVLRTETAAIVAAALTLREMGFLGDVVRGRVPRLQGGAGRQPGGPGAACRGGPRRGRRGRRRRAGGDGCCVTNEALAKSRKAVRRAARTAGRVYVTGCGANLADPGWPLPANVHVVRVRPDRAPAAVSEAVGPLGCVGGPAPAFARTRAYVKIQDGCSFGCSYCVIPSVRGAGRSRTPDAVLRDAARRPTGPPRAGADRHQPGLLSRPRARATWRSCSAGVRAARSGARPPELDRGQPPDRPAAAGDGGRRADRAAPARADAVRRRRRARAMRRRYARDRFLQKLARARELVPGVNLTTDVIVGHPSEDDAGLRGGRSPVPSAGFTAVHVFPYSPRPDTRDAANDRVPAAEKRDARRGCGELSDRAGAAHRRAKLGRRERVLVEPARGGGYARTTRRTGWRAPSRRRW